ncbi:MAG: PHP domain-containing protein [Salinivenus sp.]
MATDSVYADLHTHSHCSDGHLSPPALVQRAATQGLQVLALTDHDTVQGLAAAADAARTHGIQLVPGVELSLTENGDEIHVLAYGFDAGNAALQAHLQAFREARRERAWAMVDRLRAHGCSLREAVVADAFEGTQSLGRPHVAQALVAAGHVDTLREAFEQYLGTGQPGFVEKPAAPASEALKMVHEAGGVGVLAHPGHWTSSRRIRRLVDQGLDGLESAHPSHDASLRGYYERLADGYGLFVTGGSDYHGGPHRSDDPIGEIGLTQNEWERCRPHLA